jgi:hypothetical protein
MKSGVHPSVSPADSPGSSGVGYVMSDPAQLALISLEGEIIASAAVPSCGQQ